MKIYFIRHGDPCRYSHGITDNGVQSVRLLGERLRGHPIRALYSSTHQRARETTAILSSLWEVVPLFEDWLKEFKYPVYLDDITQLYPWELPPSRWIDDDLLDNRKTFANWLYSSGNIGYYYAKVCHALDNLLEAFGYKQLGKIYKVTSSNPTTLVIVSHFATISVMLSHLLKVPLHSMFHMFWMAPASLNIVQTEEMEKGMAIFRCSALNDCAHLRDYPSLQSQYGLNPEIFE